MLPRSFHLLLLLMPAAAYGQAADPLFTLLPPEETGVSFINVIAEREGANVLEYEYFYNGGGVAVGDVDGDGLPDLFFTANMGGNALYLNRGDFTFEDVTRRAGVQGRAGWTTGVTMADVNGDGRLDLYVCKSGWHGDDERRNELYINRGGLRFTEQAARYGLDDPAHSTHATFFDYDRDGDLDLFLLNHSIKRYTRFDVAYMKAQRDPLAGDKLYRNDPGSGPGQARRFVDVSEAAGIIGNPLGFGLSAVAGDFDGDGWPDLYVSNDYVEEDYFYLNNGDGTFREDVRGRLGHTSFFSMGADAADFNNDGRLDLVTLDMMPEDNRRQKLLKGPDGYDRYQMMIGYGYHHQYMRNMLHLNNGNKTFSEIGQLAGISNTDWSWAALLADFDNDGWKDLFVTNGYMRDYTNMDFLKYTVQEANREAQRRGEELDLFALVQRMPSTQLTNYIFRNEGDLTFSKQTTAWGLDQAALSNGAAYGDLDADGDLDLVVNNINAPAFLYRNDADRHPDRRFLRVRLEGTGKNPFGVGARVRLTTPEGRTLYQELMPSRGYQSSVEPLLVFGLGTAAEVDLAVTWPDGNVETRRGVAAGQTLTLRQADAAAPAPVAEAQPEPPFYFVPEKQGLHFTHVENGFIDFKREPLLPHLLSRLGPALAQADVNRDGLPDVFVGGAHGQAGALFLQQVDATFRPGDPGVFAADASFEDVDALFFDADGDGDQDLYVVSGGSFEAEDLSAYQDRLYLNNGFGGFTRAPDALPPLHSSGAVAAAHDYDGDGDLDLFVGGRVLPGRYPLAPRSFLLENTAGRFTDVTERIAPALRTPGMVADALWADLDGDGPAELLLAGEWMPLRAFRRTGDGTFIETTEQVGLSGTEGWWNCLEARDLDGDGDLDVVAGNRGLNDQMRALPEEPTTLYAADFDDNGTIDPILSYYIQGRSYPMAARDELLDQINALKKRYTTYAAYADETVEDLFPPDRLERALRLEARTFATTLFENRGGRLEARALPVEAQFTPINCIRIDDFDGDGRADLLLAGNNFAVRAQTGRYDAGQGLLLRGRGDLTFEAAGPAESGFVALGDVRRMELVRTPAGTLVVLANNNAPLSTFVY